MNIEQPIVLDLLSQQGPALSSISDMPVVETKPDAQNEVPAEPTPEKVEAEQSGESATPATDEQDGQPTEPRGVGKALAQLRQQRKEAEAEAAKEREQRIRLEERLKMMEERKPPEPEVVQEEPAQPDRADFPDPDTWEQAMLDYVKQRASWEAKTEIKRVQDQARKEADEIAAKAEVQKSIDGFNERLSKTKEKYPDFDQVVDTPDVFVSPVVNQVIINSPDGAELQYLLGKNPAEAQRILALPYGDQLIEAGKLLAKANTPTKPISAAPPPITTLKTTISPADSRKDPEDMSMEEYAVYRYEREKARGRH